MADTLNISLTRSQRAWLSSRKTEGGFASNGEVVRELIRHEQEKERAALAAEFEALDQDGAPGPDPVERVVAAVHKVRKALRRETRRRP